MKYIIMLHGPPCSGKSTAAAKIENALKEKGYLAEVVKSTSKRFKEGEKVPFTVAAIDETIPETKKSKDDSYKSVIAHAKETIKRGGIAILDATFHKKERRKWVYAVSKKEKVPLLIVSLSFTHKKTILYALEERRNNPNKKETIIQEEAQYQLMVDQTEPISEKEKKEHNLHIIDVDRTTAKVSEENLLGDEVTKVVLEAIR